LKGFAFAVEEPQDRRFRVSFVSATLGCAVLGMAFSYAACSCKGGLTPGQVAYGKLLDAGCVSPDPNFPTAVGQQLESGAPICAGDASAQNCTPPWLVCLTGTGSISSCGAPCSPEAAASGP
jgi:hypothetical protein